MGAGAKRIASSEPEAVEPLLCMVVSPQHPRGATSYEGQGVPPSHTHEPPFFNRLPRRSQLSPRHPGARSQWLVVTRGHSAPSHPSPLSRAKCAKTKIRFITSFIFYMTTGMLF